MTQEKRNSKQDNGIYGMSGKNFDELQFREVYNKIHKRRKKHYFLRFLILVAILTGIYFFMSSSYFDVKSFEVTGNKYYTDSEVIALSKARPGKNIFFELKKKDLISRLKKDPYFKDVKIKRHIPDKVEIVVNERKQTAALIYADAFVVIDEEGVVLRKTDVMPKVTQLTGLNITKIKEGEKLKVKQSGNLKKTLEIIKYTQKGKLFFKKIDFSKVVIRAHIYDDLLVKGTPDQIIGAIKRGDLQKVLANLFDEEITKGTINTGGDGYISFSPEIG